MVQNRLGDSFASFQRIDRFDFVVSSIHFDKHGKSFMVQTTTPPILRLGGLGRCTTPSRCISFAISSGDS